MESDNGMLQLDCSAPDSIGPVSGYYGNFGVCLRALVYVMMLGGNGLREASETAVLNANYVMNKLKGVYDLPFDTTCMHEFVLSAVRQAEQGVTAFDIAKALIDRGFHPPTMYFPLIVKEALMIEPTETESMETLDRFVAAMLEIAELAASDPDSLKAAPITTPVSRPDEVAAAKNMEFTVEKKP